MGVAHLDFYPAVLDAKNPDLLRLAGAKGDRFLSAGRPCHEDRARREQKKKLSGNETTT